MINVAMVSCTPLAGAPLETAKCLNKYASGRLNVRWIADSVAYGDGRRFPKDLLLGEDRAEALDVLEQADIIHIQNAHFSEVEKYFSTGKRIIAQFHSCPKLPTVGRYLQITPHCFTLNQPMQVREFPHLPQLPNLMDPEEYTPLEPRPIRSKPRILFAPTNDRNKFTVGSKGRAEILPMLESVREFFDVEVFSNLPYVQNLERKRQADILIDDVVNGTFNKTALEGCCFGLATITGSAFPGWLQANLGTLRETLLNLRDPENLLAVQKLGREWITEDYHPRKMADLYLQAYEKVLR